MGVENEINANSAFNKVGVGVEVELGKIVNIFGYGALFFKPLKTRYL